MSGNLLIHKEFLRTLPEALTTELKARAVSKRFQDLDLPTRLAKRILELAGDHGAAQRGGGLAIDLHLPQEDLAAMVGATREAVGRHLKRFEREGWIELAYGRLVLLSREGLASLL